MPTRIFKCHFQGNNLIKISRIRIYLNPKSVNTVVGHLARELNSNTQGGPRQVYANGFNWYIIWYITQMGHYYKSE